MRAKRLALASVDNILHLNGIFTLLNVSLPTLGSEDLDGVCGNRGCRSFLDLRVGTVLLVVRFAEVPSAKHLSV